MRAALGYDRSYTEEQMTMSIDTFLRENYYSGDMDAEEIMSGLMVRLNDAANRSKLWDMYMRGDDLEEIVSEARYM